MTTGAKSARPISASEIARSVKKFETWSAHQACTLASFADLPEQMKEDALRVFNVKGLIPLDFVDGKSPTYLILKQTIPDFVQFLETAREKQPALFARNPPKCENMLSHLCSVFEAWRKLCSMRKSSQRWTEADYAGQVYSLIRSPAISSARLRLQCPVALPEPPNQRSQPGTPHRIVAARSLIPDATTFVSSRRLQALCGSKNSAYNLLKKAAGDDADLFRAQATPAYTVSDQERFEFASSVMEDKKPDQTKIDNAWRQNRMACAAIARHYHAFNVNAPVFGLVWGEGTVRAHVDWASVDPKDGHACVYSAPYPVPENEDRRESAASTASAAPQFQVWDLTSASAIIAVHLLVRNIDKWTANQFAQRVLSGVQNLADKVDDGTAEFVGWKNPARKPVTKSSPGQENVEVRVEKKEKTTVAVTTTTTTRRQGLRAKKGPAKGG